jgi:hypothetical protein
MESSMCTDITDIVASRLYTTYIHHSFYGPVYLACGPGWGPLKSWSPIDVIYFVLLPNGRMRDVATSCEAASYAAAWACCHEGASDLRIMRSDNVEVRNDCDACGSQGEAMLFQSGPKICEYLCENCWETRLLTGNDKHSCQPVQKRLSNRGRRSGPAGFRDTQEFQDMLIDLIQGAHAIGKSTLQKDIALIFRPVLDKRRRDTGSAKSVDIDVDSTCRLIRKHIHCSWNSLVKKALQPP